MISVFYIDENRSAEEQTAVFKWAVLDLGEPEVGRSAGSYYQYNGL